MYCGLPAGTRVDPNRAYKKKKGREGRPPSADPVCRHYVPILVSYHVLELYNGALRRAHGFPKLNPDFVTGFHL